MLIKLEMRPLYQRPGHSVVL